MIVIDEDSFQKKFGIHPKFLLEEEKNFNPNVFNRILKLIKKLSSKDSELIKTFDNSKNKDLFKEKDICAWYVVEYNAKENSTSYMFANLGDEEHVRRLSKLKSFM